MLTSTTGGDDEAGFTLVELLVSMSILMLVLGALLGGLQTLFSSERRASTHIDDEQSARLMLEAITRDLRSANPVVAQASVGAYAGSADVLAGPVGGSQTQYEWAYDGVATVTRYKVTGATKIALARYPAVVNGVAVPVFKWFGPGGEDLATLSSSTARDVARCATSVQVTLMLASRRGVPPVTETTLVALKNQSALLGCA